VTIPPLRLVVVTAAADLPDLSDGDGWAAALRLRGLIQGLQAGGCAIAGVLGADARLPERLADLAPDLLIIDARSGARDAIEQGVRATRDATRPLVLFSDERDGAPMKEAVAAGVVAYVVAGLATERVRPVIDVAIACFAQASGRGLRDERAQVRDPLEERDQISRAKSLLMTRHGLTEPEAYARMRRTAMNQALTIAEIARCLLALANLRG